METNYKAPQKNLEIKTEQPCINKRTGRSELEGIDNRLKLLESADKTWNTDRKKSYESIHAYLRSVGIE